MIEIDNSPNTEILEVKAIETLSQSDFDHLRPVLEKHVAENTQPRLLLVMEEFKGWDDTKALWQDLKMDTKHINDFVRIALVGDAEWEKWMTKLVNPLTPNEIRFFKPGKIAHARRWLKQGPQV